MTQAEADQGNVDTLKAAREYLRRHGKVALATVVDTWGSAPVPVGGQLAIAPDGTFQGSVSGGCIEGEVITQAEEVLQTGKPETLSFGIADETAWNVGLPCGGKIKVYLERLTETAADVALVDRAIAARESRQGLVVRTWLGTGERQTFERAPDLPEDIAQRFQTAKSTLQDTPDGLVFTQAIIPAARIVAIGAGHISQILSQYARIAGYEIVVVDPRTAFASAERFPGVRVMADWPRDALAALKLDDYTALAVLAHVDHIDDEALMAGVRSPCLYVGALGSSRNQAKRVERLKAAGLSDAEIARIKNPIGLDIGAQSPAEIALAVMAEIVQAVRGTKAGKSKRG
jgi:xanthine dehydrogenase accessory factor